MCVRYFRDRGNPVEPACCRHHDGCDLTGGVARGSNWRFRRGAEDIRATLQAVPFMASTDFARVSSGGALLLSMRLYIELTASVDAKESRKWAGRFGRSRRARSSLDRCVVADASLGWLQASSKWRYDANGQHCDQPRWNETSAVAIPHARIVADAVDRGVKPSNALPVAPKAAPSDSVPKAHADVHISMVAKGERQLRVLKYPKPLPW